MDPTTFSELDLARLALSERLKDLSDELRQAVAAPDGPSGEGPAADSLGSALAQHVWQLLDFGVPALKDSLVAYLRARETPWGWIAETAGLGEDEARTRWGRISPDHLADAQATAAALDAWYVRHAQLEPLAQVADPVSRLLGDSTPQQDRCLICAKYAKEPVPAWAGRPVPPGGHVVDDGTWRVGHGPTAYWPRGTLLIESRRHFLDYSEISPEEAASLGVLVRRLTGPLKAVTGAPRVHVWSCMEGTAHFHMWLVPRVQEVASGRAFIGNPGYCAETEAEQVVDALRAALELEPDGART